MLRQNSMHSRAFQSSVLRSCACALGLVAVLSHALPAAAQSRADVRIIGSTDLRDPGLFDSRLIGANDLAFTDTNEFIVTSDLGGAGLTFSAPGADLDEFDTGFVFDGFPTITTPTIFFPTVRIPSMVFRGSDARPTSVTSLDEDDFFFDDGIQLMPARFFFTTDEGTIAAFNPRSRFFRFNRANDASIVIDRSFDDALFTSVTTARTSRGRLIFATDFNRGRVVVFDRNFIEVDLPGNFVDRRIPRAFAPINIEPIGDELFVTFARRGPRGEVLTGAGQGFISVFDTNGRLVRRFVRRGPLNAPFSMAVAPRNFGDFDGALLVSNLGSGRITVFDLETGQFRGFVRDRLGRPIRISGLRGIAFGRGRANDLRRFLFFTANGNSDGVMGAIRIR